MNNGTSWGLYIAAFMFFVGLSAGGLIVAHRHRSSTSPSSRRWRCRPCACPRCASAARACWSSSTSAAWRASST
ncbi:MAG: NrfD/PsrC family molybdoenzyme membrane anchor subunit [Eggerthella lenta]